ncbi:DUF397 domain-containing protein [Streptomyces sp. PmtG]
MTTRTDWQKSSFSGGGEGNDCVELAATEGRLIHLRESDAPGVELTTTPTALAHLVGALKAAAGPPPTTPSR